MKPREKLRFFFAALAALLGEKKISDRNILLRVVNAHYRLGQPANAKALAAFSADNSANETGRREALTALAACRGGRLG